MKLEVGNNQGHVIVDKDTGKIISVFVRNIVEGKSDWYNFASYKNNHDGTYSATRWCDHPEIKQWKFGSVATIEPLSCSNHQLDLEWGEQEEELNNRMDIIGQNGNTGEHYELFENE